MRWRLVSPLITMLLVGGGMLTQHYFPWNLIPVLIGGYAVGLMANVADGRR